jgi:hypothetical protein
MLIRTIALAIGTMAMIGALQVLLPTAAEAQRRPPTTCYHERTVCLQASAQHGPNGQQYVPPPANDRCQGAYRAWNCPGEC